MSEKFKHIKKILLCKGQGVYNASRYFIDRLAAAFQDENIHVDLLDYTDSFDFHMFDQYDLIFSFNCMLLEGIAPHVHNPNTILWGFLLDHPIYHHKRLLHTDEKYCISCVDREHVSYINKCYPHIKSSCFVPLAGKLPLIAPIPYKDREYDVVFLGSFVNMTSLEKELSNLPTLVKPIVEYVINSFLSGAQESFDNIFYKQLEKNGVQLEGEEFAGLLNEIASVEQYIQMKLREKAINTIATSGIKIHLFGRGWETFECERPQNLIIHSSVDYLEGINILCNSKVVLNIPPLFRNGIHDRVLSAMLCGAACVSERSLYQEEQFTDKETICFYDVKHIDKLPSIINHLLQNANEAETIINKAKKIAEKNHTWKNRALTILEQSEAILIDRSRKISE